MQENKIEIAYDHPDTAHHTCSTAHAWAKKPREPEANEKAALIERIKRLLKEQDAVLVSHYYVHPTCRTWPSRPAASFPIRSTWPTSATSIPAKTIVVAGVRFMGETAKILNPEKRVLMPDLEAECSLDLGCPIDEFAAFCDAHPDRIVVVYANTSAAVKARADWMVTSSIALPVVKHLHGAGQEDIVGAGPPPRQLRAGTDRRRHAVVARLVHRARRIQGAGAHRAEGAASGCQGAGASRIAARGGAAGGCGRLHHATDQGGADIRPPKNSSSPPTTASCTRCAHCARTKSSSKRPPPAMAPTCTSCSHCPWMAMNGLLNLAEVLEKGHNEIHVDPAIIPRAVLPIKRMLDFAKQINLPTRGIGNA